MKIPTGATKGKNTGATITKANPLPANVLAKNPGGQGWKRANGKAKRTNRQMATTDDTKLLLHN